MRGRGTVFPAPEARGPAPLGPSSSIPGEVAHLHLRESLQAFPVDPQVPQETFPEKFVAKSVVVKSVVNKKSESLSRSLILGPPPRLLTARPGGGGRGRGGGARRAGEAGGAPTSSAAARRPVRPPRALDEVAWPSPGSRARGGALAPLFAAPRADHGRFARGGQARAIPPPGERGTPGGGGVGLASARTKDWLGAKP